MLNFAPFREPGQPYIEAIASGRVVSVSFVNDLKEESVNRKTLIFVFIAILTLFIASVAQAQATRTWVSGVGDDVNPCSRTAPCKTFAGAISKTATGGEISVLDPGGFGAVTITKAITINGDGTLAGILAANTVGIIINAPTTASVTIRNVSIHGAGTGTDGIRILSAARVNIEQVSIQGFINQGIDIIPSTAGLIVQTNVNNCDIRGNTQQGIQVLPTGTATVKLTVSDSRIENNASSGIDIGGANNAGAIFNSTLAFNLVGAQVQQATSELFLDSVMVANNTTGITSGVGQAAVTHITNCSVVNNGTGIGGAGTTVGHTSNTVVGNTAGNAVSSTVPEI